MQATFLFRCELLIASIIAVLRCCGVSTAADRPPSKPPPRVALHSSRRSTDHAPLPTATKPPPPVDGRRFSDPYPLPPEMRGVDLMRQTADEAATKSQGCIQCHTGVGDMHQMPTVRLGCTDCHGGNAKSVDKLCAHVLPRFPQGWTSSANPVRSYTLLNHESPQFVRFVNPGDLRVAHISCGNCHAKEVLQVRKSMMTHGSMLWGAALYNNGSYPLKSARFGESYSMYGAPQRLQTVPPPSDYDVLFKGVVPYLDPLPRFEVGHPGNVLRIFERGGRFIPDSGNPERVEENGRPRTRVSVRGFGTQNRVDPVVVSLAKTRLFDPTLNFLGTNDHAGDYRSSGCTACHVIYANDRSPVHSGPYADKGHQGLSFSADPMIPKNEPGHPIDHKFTRAIPSSQCIVCHVHPGTNVMNSYLGFMWWDNETDGRLMYPREEKEPTAEEAMQALISNPEESSVRGLWSEPEFLDRVSELNDQASHTQFADFHGHGWVFKAVFRKDREGQFLDYKGDVVKDITPAKLVAAMKPPTHEERVVGKRRADTPVHFMDIHLEKGMHCVDCHFQQDVHGNGKLYGEVRAAIEIGCDDCHGTIYGPSKLRTSGPAAPEGGTNLLTAFTPFKRPRFETEGNKLIQNSMVEEGLRWEVKQVVDSINPADPEHFNAKACYAKTVRFEQGRLVWGDVPVDRKACAHRNEAMSCMACHSSWNPSCYGCHLPQKANMKLPSLHYEGDVSRNYVAYNFQTLRDDVYMLAKDGNATRNRIGPARSSCAIHVTSYNQNREAIYIQQQTVSADGLSGIAFSTNVPHTVRGSDGTKSCTDCHLSAANDNNAIMAQLLMQGTNFVNFIGNYCWVGAGDHGIEAVVVTEQDEPQAVIGSSLHRLAFPKRFAEHAGRGGKLEHAHHHKSKAVGDMYLHPFRDDEILALQARGEFLYAACGRGGLRVFDIAFIDNKGFSERIISAPVSPLGQRFYVKSRYATAVAAPCTPAVDPARIQNPQNNEQAIHPMFANIYVTDRDEGLIVVGAATLLDGDPTNNFLRREVTFNPRGILNGARSITIVGTYAYICCNRGLVVVSLEDPKHPCVTSVIGGAQHRDCRAVQVQFRYAFLCDAGGITVLDVTNLAEPREVASLALKDARSIYVARSYAYVAAGREGLVIVDVKNPEEPRVDQVFDAGGCLHDVNDVKLGITYASEFAYLADGKQGLLVVQLTSAEMLTNQGFNPRPQPRLVATHKLSHEAHALCVSEGVDRDRAVDESGNQIGVFGRLGARPLNLVEQRRLYVHGGQVWKVGDEYDISNYRGTVPLPQTLPEP
jgi:hypothetical protein